MLSPPRNGETVGGRPLLNLSLALNYALGGLEVWGYHATNLAIHLAAAWLLFGILRRTLPAARLRDRFGGAATPLALAVALLWMRPSAANRVGDLHRAAGGIAGGPVLSADAVLRDPRRADRRWVACSHDAQHRVSMEAARPSRHADPRLRRVTACPPPTAHRFWYAAAVLACLLGMATKEVMVTAPLVVLLYDRTFLAGSFREAWRRRGGCTWAWRPPGGCWAIWCCRPA